MGLLGFFGQESLAEKEAAIRIEKAQRNFFWLGIGFVLILLKLPLIPGISLGFVYLLVLIFVAFTLFWYYLLPKKFSGRLKNMVFIALSITFISLFVHWTGGVKSFALFLYVLVALTTAVSMSFLVLLLFMGLVAVNIFLQAFLTFGTPNFVTNLSIASFHTWGILMIALYGRLISSQLTLAKIEEKKAEIERAEEIDHLQDEFIFFVSHKLKLPISTLSDYLVKMSNLTSTKKIKDISEQLWQASLKLSRLVDLFLDVARIESGHLMFAIQKLDLPDCIKTVIENFEPLARTRHIKILYQGPDKLSTNADPDRICEILTNLIDNAIKLSREGSEVNLKVERSDGRVITSVIDHAGGISLESQKHIFEKYYRAKEGGKVPGTGLGLYISKKLVEKQNGKIWFETHSGEGTTFSFSLPLAKK
ncbi:hypothetical protein A2Z23_00030 [Candidatus Curtissbacteria bacterium RBG_16_39_7]|uniref:histidine kinase n=1 Tax=Candidatus Curtissbacteria bacterium RBG_16_39_7 TaxID=1797707 RepID=A0A1F5G3S2_9BACT|nr:MAG: hypothetical protein A2Z23_00030 [Candidatus Curtissbacteria bacterium RBG_16_39_7]